MRETDVTFASGDVTLAGTMAWPDGDAPFPAALLIAGSGSLDRNANHKSLALNLSRDLARVLTDEGWATLRFDKRGVGESGGNYLSTGFFEELADAEAALDWLGAHADVGPIVAIGHSAGGLQAAELAGRERKLAGAVLLASPAQDGEAILQAQARDVGEHMVPGPVKLLLKLFGTSVEKQQAKATARVKATTTDSARMGLTRKNVKWLREFIAYDPAPALRRANAPILAITGAKDIQVNAADLEIVAAVAPATTEVLRIHDVDHLMPPEPAEISRLKKYRKQLKKPVDPRVTDAVVDWLRRVPLGESRAETGA